MQLPRSGGKVSSGPGATQIEVHLGSAKFDEDDERWLGQQRDLFVELRREVGSVSLRLEAEPGSKGSVETIVVALGTAGVFQAAASIFQAWLGRDRTRRIELTWNRDGHTESFILEGSGVDKDTLSRLAAEINRSDLGL
jgi:hypothetical protein